MLIRKTQVAAKVEGTKGSAETLAAGDAAIMASNVVPNSSPPPLERDVMFSTLSKEPSIPGARRGTLSFRVEIKGSGTIDTAPALGVLFKGCGCDETVSASTSVAYNPDSDDADTETLTLGVNVDGSLWQIYGARGNAVLTLTPNGLCWVDFSFTGIWDAFTAAAAWSGISYESTEPTRWYNAAFTLNYGGAWATGVVGDYGLDFGNDVRLKDDANSSTGLKYAKIIDRNPVGSFVIDQVLPSDEDFYSYMETPTMGSLSLLLGTATGNKLTITAPKLQIQTLTPGERDGDATWTVGAKYTINSGDDEWVLTFT